MHLEYFTHDETEKKCRAQFWSQEAWAPASVLPLAALVGSLISLSLNFSTCKNGG